MKNQLAQINAEVIRKAEQGRTAAPAQHSPIVVLADRLIKTEEHAQRLADALERVLDVITGDQAAELGVYEALAQWNATKGLPTESH